MKLVIGGYAQGKLRYVLKRLSGQEGCIEKKESMEKGNQINSRQEECQEAYVIWDGILSNEEIPQGKTLIIHHFHNWVKTCMAEGKDPETLIFEVLKKYPDCVVICDEIGNGIVPIEAKEREYRERTGRLLIKLAERAEEVERVICGIGQKIK